MGSPIETFGLYKRTLPHHKRSQLLWRMRFWLRRRVLGRRAPMPKLPPQWDLAALDRVAKFAQEHADVVGVPGRFLRVLGDGELLFLNYPVQIEGGIPWHGKVATKLWRCHLHYLEWCRWAALSPDRGEDTPEQVRGWLLDWQASNPPGADITWDSAVLTQRLLNWSLIQAALRLDDEILACSYVQQAHYLSRNLERDVLANHLLKNAAALALAGVLLGENNLRDTALALLEAELAEQVLPDGGHFERSPMYHLQLLEALLMLHAALPKPPDFLIGALRKMTDFATQLQHPDGDIPLFNDAGRDPSRPADKLATFARRRLDMLAAAKPSKEPIALAECGFYIMSPGDPKSRMIVRAGDHGPSYQLAHAHSDLLSYELSLDGKRLVVDSGVHGYGDDNYRDYSRSTRAHNTISVNGMEQLEAWGVFRVGRRGSAKALAFETTGYGQYFYGEHNAFTPYIHRRRIHCDRLGLWFVIDEIEGPGKIQAESYVHLHPLWSIAARRGYYSIRTTETMYRIFPINAEGGSLCRGQKEPVQQGWYMPEFGKAQQAWCLTLRATGESKLRFGYAIVPRSGNIRSNHDLAMYVDVLDKEHGFDPVALQEAPEDNEG